MSTTERDALVLALDRALQAGLIGHDAENFLLTEIDAALAAPSGGMPTPPPVAQEAVDEAIALLVEQMDMLRADAQKWHDGDPKFPFAVIRDALIAALNAYDDAVPALRALLTRPVAQGEAVAWQYRIAMRSGQWAWSMWFDPITDKSEFDAVIQCQRDAGNEVETRQLYDHPAPEREGWKLVPVTPTTAMLNAGSDSHEYGAHRLCAQMWKDMLAAAPTTGSAGE